MPPIIDVDSHWTMPWEFHLEDGPLRAFKDDLPAEGGMLSFFLAGDLLDSLPDDARPTPDQLFPYRRNQAGELTQVPAQFEVNRKSARASERIVWMDDIGIDYAIVNSGGFPAAFPLIDDLDKRKAYCSACNDLLAAELDGYQARLGQVAYADLNDLDWAIGELTRMRSQGSRAFSIRAEPVGGLSLAHSHFDRLWSAVADLGMIVSVHTGLAPSLFGAWGAMGLDYDDPEGRGRFLRMANSQRQQSAELMLSALLFGGVFQRHPKLTVLIAELNVFWLPTLVRRLASFSTPMESGALGPWRDPTSGAEYLRRQVRATPLPGLGDFNAIEVLQAEPEMVVFSSDYPHSEGNADPINIYEPKLSGVDPAVRDKFMGSTMAESYRRMGDPILAAA